MHELGLAVQYKFLVHEEKTPGLREDGQLAECHGGKKKKQMVRPSAFLPSRSWARPPSTETCFLPNLLLCQPPRPRQVSGGGHLGHRRLWKYLASFSVTGGHRKPPFFARVRTLTPHMSPLPFVITDAPNVPKDVPCPSREMTIMPVVTVGRKCFLSH